MKKKAATLKDFLVPLSITTDTPPEMMYCGYAAKLCDGKCPTKDCPFKQAIEDSINDNLYKRSISPFN